MVRPAAAAAAANGTSPSASSARRKRLFLALLPPLLALAGLGRFSTSFFLARRSLAAKSACGASRHLLTNVLGLSSREVQQLVEDGYVIGDGDENNDGGEGCWVPRTVDATIIVVVDALRFDFAVGRLPKSIGSRLRSNKNDDEASQSQSSQQQQSRLFTFVADPPTVTMQRLKGLTTGGLPTFADISGNFGGASIEEDSWVQQLRDVPVERRRRHRQAEPSSGEKTQRVGARMAFVGDDTWVDLFPTQFDDSNPYPSFNTRDLDSVDDGCMEHLPRLLSNLGGGGDAGAGDEIEGKFELVVAHFLGVDHVGHTYGPHDRHMTEKLAQMDDALSYVLETIDSTPTDSCRAALVFGDHGMTEDGNHGGGTEDETNAALFVHYSKGCGGMGHTDTSAGDGVADADTAIEAFESIHQIDLVPTISAMLGLPVPYANLGGLVPALLPSPRKSRNQNESAHDDDSDLARVEAAAAALALNAAQIWNYLDTYSRTANKLPAADMLGLKELLDKATEAYRTALLSSAQHQDGKGSPVVYREACSLYKLFLSEATELGNRVWTRFDTNGMILGGILLGMALLVSFPAWNSILPALGDCREWILHYIAGLRAPSNASLRPALHVGKVIESGAALLFMIFHCLVLTFSNSYIESEKHIIMFLLGSLSLSMAIRQWINVSKGEAENIRTVNSKDHTREVPAFPTHAVWMPILVALCSRSNALFVSGHGLDPSIRMHAVHAASVFLPSLVILAVFRIITSHVASFHRPTSHFTKHGGASVDILCLAFYAFSWWEKRSPDHSRNGYRTCRAALLISLLGVVVSIFMLEYPRRINGRDPNVVNSKHFHSILSLLFKVLIFTIGTMGPAAAASSVFFLIQAWALHNITSATGLQSATAPVAASLWRMSIRHAFFATNHAPTFSRLQYSAAFVASDNFHFHTAGISLFLNTFGWEIMGTLLVMAAASQANRRKGIWSWFCFYQLLEASGSCISVSLMRRHLMVWAIFAPRFVFACVFTLISLSFWIFGAALETERESGPDPRPKRPTLHSNRRSTLLSLFISLLCVTSSASAYSYSTLTIVDAENVRGKSHFRLRHDDLVHAVGLWTVAQESIHSCSLVIDHGSIPSSFYQPLDRTNDDNTDGIAILFAGPNEKADDVIARDVSNIASTCNVNDMKVIRVITSDQGLRSRCRIAFDEALGRGNNEKKKKKKTVGRRKGSSRQSRRGASSSDSLVLEFIPSIAFLSELERELARCGSSHSERSMEQSLDISRENLVDELHKDIELRGNLYQVETSLRETKKSSSAHHKQLLVEKGRKMSHQIYNSRDEGGETILDLVLKAQHGGKMTIDETVLSKWHEIRCQAGRSELTGDRMLQAEYLRRTLEKTVTDEQSLFREEAHTPSALHYRCHQRFHKGRQPTGVPFTISAFDTALESMRIVIVSGTVPPNDELLPEGDVLLHLGDFTRSDDESKNLPKQKRNDKCFMQFDEWLSRQPHQIKLVLRGMNDPPAAKVDLPRSKAVYLDRPNTVSFGGGNFRITLVPHCTERDLSSSWRRLPHSFDVLVCRQTFHEAQMIARRVELMFSGPPQLWLAGDVSRGYDKSEHLVAEHSVSMRETKIICGKEWGSEDDTTDNLAPFVIDLTKEMGSGALTFNIVH